MNRNRDFEQLRSAFLEQNSPTFLHDLFVTKYRNPSRNGPRSRGAGAYTVIYDGDTQSVLRLVLANEPELGMLRRRLVFDLHDEASNLHVCLTLTASRDRALW